jgi:glucokinase
VTARVIGVDVGGTKIAAAPLTGAELGESRIEPTQLDSGDELVDQIVTMVEAVRGAERLDGLGVGVPSVVEFETGRVVSSANVPLADVKLREELGTRLDVPVFVDNDANVAALAEAHDESLRLVAHDVVMLTVGTGVGGGLVLGGRIYRGATGGAGEIGHTIVGLDVRTSVPPPQKFPQAGSLEFVASGHALDRLAAEDAAERPDSALGRLKAAGKPVLGPDAVEAAHAGDGDAQRIIKEWGQRIGIGVANAINTFDPEEVVIGGGAARAGDLLLTPAREVAGGYVLPGLGSRTKIRLARHGVRAGVLGAALLAEQEVAGPEAREDATWPEDAIQTTEVSG